MSSRHCSKSRFINLKTDCFRLIRIDAPTAQGGLVGFLGTLIAVAIYVYSTADNFGQYGYFFSESTVIFVVLSLPTILTGVIAALLKKGIYKS